jgi:hypothetical protein
MRSVTAIADGLKKLMGETARQLGREIGFVRRQSKLDGAAFAQLTVLGWQEHPDASLPQLAQTAAQVGVKVSPQGINERFSPAAASFLRARVEHADTTFLVSASPVAVPVLARFSEVSLADTSVISLPDVLAALWRGCGNDVDQHQAALKVALRYDLLRGTLRSLTLEPARTADRSCALQRQVLPAGALSITDLGFFAVARFADLAAHGAFFLSRLQVQTALFTLAGERLELASFLAAQTGRRVDCALTMGQRERLPVRLLAVRVPQEVADLRRMRLKDEAATKGKTVSRARLALVDWTILITNAPTDLLSLDEALVLYRLRWQIEILFKLWKNWGHLDDWRTHNPSRILCEVYAKLLGQFLLHASVTAFVWCFPDRSLVKVTKTVRDHVLLITYALAGQLGLDLGAVLSRIEQTVVSCPRLERRRKHPAAFQLLEDLDHAA